MWDTILECCLWRDHYFLSFDTLFSKQNKWILKENFPYFPYLSLLHLSKHKKFYLKYTAGLTKIIGYFNTARIYNRIFFLASFLLFLFIFIWIASDTTNCQFHVTFDLTQRIELSIFKKLFRNIKQNIHQWSITKKVNGYIFFKYLNFNFIMFFF